MKLGALVAKKQRWNLNSYVIGIVVAQATMREDKWLVLWNIDGCYKLQEHLTDALINLEDYSEEVLKSRICISM